MPDAMCELVAARARKNLVVMACASANILTMHPKEKLSVRQAKSVDSHRRHGLVAQFKAAKLVMTGLQETRRKWARASGIGP